MSPSSDSLSLRLRLHCLNLARHHHSPVHSTKGTPSHLLDAPTACKHTVSGSISLRSRGSFHLSLTVLSAIGRQGVFSLRRWSSQIPTGFLVSRSTWVLCYIPPCVSATGLSPSLADLPMSFSYTSLPAGSLQVPSHSPATPHTHRLQPIPRIRFGLLRFRSPLLTESRLLSFPGGNEMFQFPPFATCCYEFTARQFGNPGISTRLTISPGLSQSSTPFIASWRQDIPHTPLVAWPH
jgi:hypothetical protein